MADLRDLEMRLHRGLDAGSSVEFDQLARHYWVLARQESNYRRRRSLLKRSSSFAGLAFDAGMEEPAALRLYMDIARHTAQVHSFPQGERRKLALITARWLQVTGADQHRVLNKAKGKVALETATFGLGDIGLKPDETGQASYEAQMVDWMNRGQRLFFGTGYDGLFKAEIRAIEATEPVLSAKEYKKLAASTTTIILAAPTGQIALADFALLSRPWSDRPAWPSVVIDIAPGNYKACAFGFSTQRSDAVVTVLCPCDEQLENTVSSVDSLFL